VWRREEGNKGKRERSGGLIRRRSLHEKEGGEKGGGGDKVYNLFEKKSEKCSHSDSEKGEMKLT